MPLLTLENVSFRYNNEFILKDVSFAINEGDKIALVGNNGCGKSTLLKCLMRQLDLDSGQIIYSKGLNKIGYIEQDIPKELECQTLYNALLLGIDEDEREYNSWKVDVALEDIGTPPEMWDRKISELSGGWRRLALIARTNLNNPDILILDEPTNYLDLEKILKLEKWLKNNVKVPYLLVSHDRQFLDNVASRTLTLRDATILDYKLSFSKSRELIIQQDILDAHKRNLEEAEIKRLERSAKRMISWGISNDRLAKKGKAIMTRADKLRDDMTNVYKEKKRDISLIPDAIKPNNLLTIEKAFIETPQSEPLFYIEKLYIAKGGRVAILGKNGTGKTQLLKRLIRNANALDESQLKGKIRFNPQVNIGYFDQNLDSMPKDSTLPDYINGIVKDISNSRVTAELVNAGFLYKDQQNQIKDLSFGERARLLFLALKLQSINFYILDEPTNHLDIDGQEKLEDTLFEEENTCIFVSHDRHIVKSIANRFLLIQKGKLIEIDDAGYFYDQLENEVNNSGA